MGRITDEENIPHIPEHTQYVDAGLLTIGVAYRVLNEQVLQETYGADRPGDAGGRKTLVDDGGVAIHVFENVEGKLVEHLRFDCFSDGPHYHYLNAKTGIQEMWEMDTVADGESLTWVLERLGSRLSQMLAHAGATELATRVDQAEAAAALPKVAAAADRVKKLGATPL